MSFFGVQMLGDKNIIFLLWKNTLKSCKKDKNPSWIFGVLWQSLMRYLQIVKFIFPFLLNNLMNPKSSWLPY